jgi:NitT/TauT family transport system ATP-binding protein
MKEKLDGRLALRGVSKAFNHSGEAHVVLKDFSLEVLDKEFISIFGPNGCGKSTLLNLIAGIITPDAGTIEFAAKQADTPVGIGIAFQGYEKSLLPWRTCLDNVALPLEAEKGLSKRRRREMALALIEELGLRLPLNHYPYQMSGGQKQLTCIARAIIRRPSILLLDEPFGSLDYQTRIDMQERLQSIWGKTQITTILVSHEIDEAILLADRLFLLTSRPARVAHCFKIAFSRPRGLAALASSEFVDLRAQILRAFQGEISR